MITLLNRAYRLAVGVCINIRPLNHFSIQNTSVYIRYDKLLKIYLINLPKAFHDNIMIFFFGNSCAQNVSNSTIFELGHLFITF